jgi:hypothetical protein
MLIYLALTEPCEVGRRTGGGLAASLETCMVRLDFTFTWISNVQLSLEVDSLTHLCERMAPN